MSEEMKTNIGQMHKGEYELRGIPLSQLIREKDFVTALWLTWTGSEPTKVERIVLEACLVACIDHGTQPPSAHVARTIASCGKPMADAIAAGVLAFGPRHGNAAGAASTWLREAVAHGRAALDVARTVIEEKRRLPGIGHPEYQVDPRAMTLIDIAKTQLSGTAHCDFLLAVAQEMTTQKGKPLPANIDGALGAIVADLGVSAEFADALFLVSRTVGLIAHIREEAVLSQSYRRG